MKVFYVYPNNSYKINSCFMEVVWFAQVEFSFWCLNTDIFILLTFIPRYLMKSTLHICRFLDSIFNSLYTYLHTIWMLKKKISVQKIMYYVWRYFSAILKYICIFNRNCTQILNIYISTFISCSLKRQVCHC